MENKTVQTTNKILISSVWIILVMSLYFIYMWIAFNNIMIDEYLRFCKFPTEVTEVLLKSKFPTNFKIRYINILSVIFLFLGIFLFLLLIFVNKYNIRLGKKISNILKYTILIVAPVLIVISVSLFNYSIYNYCYVNEWIKNINGLNKYIFSDLVSDKFYDKISLENRKIIFEFLVNINNKINDKQGYNWVNLSSSWWLVELQIVVVVISTFRLNFIVNFDQQDDFKLKKIKLLQLKKTTGDPFSKRIISTLTVLSEKNFILWFIFISIIIFLPQFIYVFYINSNYSIAKELVSFSYEIPNMVIPVGTSLLRETMANAPSNITNIYYAPLISLCIMSAVIVGFIYFFLNSKTLSFSTTVYLIVIFVFVSFSSLTIIVNSQVQFEKLVNLWNGQTTYFKQLITNVIFSSNVLYGLNNNLPNVWLTGYELISSIILSYSFLIVLSFLSLMQMIKMHKQINLKKPAVTTKRV